VSLAWYFPVGIGIGILLGGWFGNLFGKRNLGMVLGALWGFAGGCWEIWKVYRRLSK
jgi:F0F1-type ATP synthase assembly protein I